MAHIYFGYCEAVLFSKKYALLLSPVHSTVSAHQFSGSSISFWWLKS